MAVILFYYFEYCQVMIFPQEICLKYLEFQTTFQYFDQLKVFRDI